MTFGCVQEGGGSLLKLKGVRVLVHRARHNLDSAGLCYEHLWCGRAMTQWLSREKRNGIAD